METFLWTPESNWGFVCLSLHSGYATDNNNTEVPVHFILFISLTFTFFAGMRIYICHSRQTFTLTTYIQKKDVHQAIHEQVDRTQKSQNTHTHTTHWPLVQKLRQIHDNRLDHFKYTDAWNLLLHLGVVKFKFQGSLKSKIYKENNPERGGKKWTKRQIHTLELAFMGG